MRVTRVEGRICNARILGGKKGPALLSPRLEAAPAPAPLVAKIGACARQSIAQRGCGRVPGGLRRQGEMPSANCNKRWLAKHYARPASLLGLLWPTAPRVRRAGTTSHNQHTLAIAARAAPPSNLRAPCVVRGKREWPRLEDSFGSFSFALHIAATRGGTKGHGTPTGQSSGGGDHSGGGSILARTGGAGETDGRTAAS